MIREKGTADIVVYGTIYTSDADQSVVTAVAVKDGKYVYVGDRAGGRGLCWREYQSH